VIRFTCHLGQVMAECVRGLEDHMFPVAHFTPLLPHHLPMRQHLGDTYCKRAPGSHVPTLYTLRRPINAPASCTWCATAPGPGGWRAACHGSNDARSLPRRCGLTRVGGGTTAVDWRIAFFGAGWCARSGLCNAWLCCSHASPLHDAQVRSTGDSSLPRTLSYLRTRVMTCRTAL
jgi:hypothetical protein